MSKATVANRVNVIKTESVYQQVPKPRHCSLIREPTCQKLFPAATTQFTAPSNHVCSDGTECPDVDTCCKIQTGFGCCPLSHVRMIHTITRLHCIVVFSNCVKRPNDSGLFTGSFSKRTHCTIRLILLRNP